ncbi:RNA 2',3'-cyclic phosphodiesterase [Alcanivorax sp. N3-2A]|nr:RNA 2',3'-cyclic phosphodiesterase [Alcanivorax sp. N3-2A]|tara:strand:- start:36321 stop:36845 length:525 start_codon:yes stop_codon:yes gene_type:complete
MRCFIGLNVTDATARRLRSLPMPAGVRPVPLADYHLTLAFLGDQNETGAKHLWPDLQAAVAPLTPFTLTLASVMAFPDHGGPIWAARALAEAPLLALHRAVRGVLDHAGVPAGQHDFAPHVTLGRGRAPLTATPLPGPWTMPVREVIFYESPGAGQAYRPLAVFPLGAGHLHPA